MYYVVTSEERVINVTFGDPGQVANLVWEQSHNWNWASVVHETVKEMKVGDICREYEHDDDFPFIVECIEDVLPQSDWKIIHKTPSTVGELLDVLLDAGVEYNLSLIGMPDVGIAINHKDKIVLFDDLKWIEANLKDYKFNKEEN